MARFNHKRNDYEKTGMRVEVKNNDVNKALRKLKKKLADDGLMQELRRREFFESKGTKKRKAKEAAIRRYKKQRAKEQDNW
ncbi:MAG: 30S ribosomal protein S21 [Flavobacteriaceae bacterium]|jgi:small subunit ribosomal protein S21